MKKLLALAGLALALVLPSCEEAALANVTCSATGNNVFMDNGKCLNVGHGLATDGTSIHLTAPSSSILGGILSATAPSGTLMSGVDTSGNPIFAPLDKGAAVNVLRLGADPSSSGASAFDNATIINSAFSATPAGRGSPVNVYLPSGTYHIKNSIRVPPGQCLIGEGTSTILDVDMDFNASASGIIVISPTNNLDYVQPCVRDLRVHEHLPPDCTAIASAATQGSTSITVSSPTCTITSGMWAYDATTASAMPIGATSVPGTSVSSVSGSTVNLSQGTQAAINNGDTIWFAQPRSGFAALGTCSTVTAGGAPCKYPWAIYDNGAQDLLVDGFTCDDCWDGIYEVGQTFHFGTIQMAAFDIGLNAGTSNNFSKIDTYVFWNFAIVQVGPGFTATPTALAAVVYDGSTIAATFGQSEGLSVDTFQIWSGNVNITNANAWISFANLELDGNGSNLNVSDCNWLQITNLYSTKGSAAPNTPVSITAPTGSCRIMVDNVRFSGNLSTSFFNMSSGHVQINNGNFIWVNSGNSLSPFFVKSGGHLDLNHIDFENGTMGTGNTFVSITGGDTIFTGNKFIGNPNGGGSTGLSMNDSASNIVSNNAWNNWSFTPSGTLGNYVDSTGRDWAFSTTTLSATGPTTLGTAGTTSVNVPLLIEGTYTLDANQGAQFEMYNYNATTGKKYVRVNSSGTLQFINSAYSSNLVSWTDAGLMTSYGGMLQLGTTVPTLASGQGSNYASTANGGVFSGYGSSYDVALANNAGSIALGVPTGSTNVDVTNLLNVNGGVENLNGTNVDLRIHNTSAGTDQKYWSISDGSGDLTIRSVNDAYSAASTWVDFVRGSGYALNYMKFAAPFVETGTIAPTLATSQGGLWASATGGAQLSGYGSTYDVQILNNAGNAALQVPTGTTNVAFPGAVSVSTNFIALGGVVRLTNTVDDIQINNTAAGTDQKYWSIFDSGASGNLSIRSASDDYSASSIWVTFNRGAAGSGTGYAVNYMTFAAPFVETGTTAPTLATSQGGMWASAIGGAQFGGYGSTYDVQLVNKSGTAALSVPTGTTNVTVAGTLKLPITGSTQCLHVDTTGAVSGMGADCGTGSGAVASVFGRTGTVTANSGDYNTDKVTEGSTNLYFTNARAIASTLTSYSAGSGTVGSSDSILAAIQKIDGNDQLKAPKASPTFTGKATTAASASGGAGFNLPNGAAPSSPAAGDIWTTSGAAGLYWYTNGTTYQAAPIDNPTFTTAVTSPQYNNSGGTYTSSAASTDYRLYASGAGIDQKYWDLFEDTSGNLKIRSINDAFSSTNFAMVFTRGTSYSTSAIALYTGAAGSAAIGLNLDNTQHVRVGNTTAPTIASGACGATTNGTIASGSNDHSGTVNIGSATTTTCTISFGSTWVTAPRACLISPANTAAATFATTKAYAAPGDISTTQFIIRGSALANANYSYACF